jgi:hypothetical protein
MSARLARVFESALRAGPGLAVAILTFAGCGGVAERPAGFTYCFPEPALFEWQKLDSSNFLVWLLPTREAFHLTAAEALDVREPADGLELVDGDRDGQIRGTGWDSIALAERVFADEDPAAAARDFSTIYYISPVNARAIEELRSTYAATRGPRRGIS